MKRAVRRKEQRGAAVFLVVLIMALLMGIGLFAVRSATYATGASGHERQMVQTHYVTEYAMLAVTSELSTDKRDAYVKLMATKPDTCANQQNQLLTMKTCYRFGYKDLEKQLASGTFLVASDLANKKPGSLGPANLEADFLVEMTDLGPASVPVAGSDLTSAGAAQVQYMAVTLTGTGQVRPIPQGASLDKVTASSASIESSRAHLIVGPLPKL